MQKERVYIVLDKRYCGKGGTFPIKIEVTFHAREKSSGRRLRKYYGTGYSCTLKQFNSITGKPRSSDLVDLKTKIDRSLAKAKAIIADNPEMTVALFESRFTGIAADTVNGCFEKMIADLVADERIGTRKTYQSALNSFKTFVVAPVTEKDIIKAAVIRFSEISADWLARYERWMIKSGRSINTIGMNLRSFRAVFNKAIANNVIPYSLYPFKKFKIRSERKYKIPLSEKEIVLLRGYTSDDPAQLEALDYFWFSYYCNGMNLVDVAQLRHSDIQEDFIIYDRSKSRRTKIQFKKIIIPIDHEIQAIIRRRQAPSLDPDGYVFPVLVEKLSAITIKNRVQAWGKEVNEGLRKVANKLKFKRKLTTVIARHTFANRLSNAGVDRRMIQESLGHQDPSTTEFYLGTMDLEKIKKAREAL